MATLPPSRLFQIPEVIEIIFRDVPPLDLLGSCRGVCRIWRDVISTSWLVKYYSLTGLHPQQRLAATSLMQLTPVARQILSLFWSRLYRMLYDANFAPDRPLLLHKMHKLYSSFQYPLQHIVLLQPPPTQQDKLNYYKCTLSPPFRGTNHEAWKVFDELFLKDYEQLKSCVHPLVNIVHKLCERAFFLDSNKLLSSNPWGQHGKAYGDDSYIRPEIVQFRAKMPEDEHERDKSGVSDLVKNLRKNNRRAAWDEQERTLSVEFVPGEPFNVALRQF